MEIVKIEEKLGTYRKQLAAEEKSPATIEQYENDVRKFAAWAKAQGERELTKASVIQYKANIAEQSNPSTVNRRLCALNRFFSFAGCSECRVYLLKIQRDNFASHSQEMTREDYIRLLKAARSRGDTRLQLMLLTLGCTGIRVSELSAITVEAVREREAVIRLKGKIRRILLPEKLCIALGTYAEARNISAGPVFITRYGNPIDRSNIWKMLKRLCGIAGVSEEKVFPHNLRHLFAREYYAQNKDIAKLADILGHSSIETTRIYVRSTGAEERRQIEALGLFVE